MMKTSIEQLLKRVTTPGQYINSEYNSETLSIMSKWQNNKVVKVCLCYPDKYVIGMSNLGMEILYKLINSLDNALCERVFTPDIDMENLLKKNNIKIFSLETQKELKDFDIIGFSLQHELCYTNVFTILSLADIPFKCRERKEKFPLVIAGGPCSSNPKVLSEYMDFFVIGEAEDVIVKIIEIVAKHKISNTTKEDLLKELNELSCIYIPSVDKDKKITPAVVDIKKSFYPELPTVPIIRTTHLRLNIELSRGCAYNCYFCQSGYIHKPLRHRDKEHIFDLILKGVKYTGYDEVAFTGFCVTSYPYLKEVMDFVHDNFRKQLVSISLPSLRIEDINEEILERLSYPRKSTITFAPEAATERLRKVLNKHITNNEIYTKLKLLYKYGFRRIKLYFMIGLPTETQEDIEAIPKFIRQIKKFFPKFVINVTVSIFIPKPHTPFQFFAMDSYESLYNKLLFLSKNLKRELHIKCLRSKIYSAFIESLITRGDEKVGRLVEQVWFAGARFDNWDEYFKPDIWIQKIQDIQIDLKEYLFTKSELETKFVWDNVQYRTTKDKLYHSYNLVWQISDEGKQENVFIHNIDLANKNSFNNSVNIITYGNTFTNLSTLRLRFSRKGKIKFISYLDEIEIIKRALRMAELPLNYTQGYNPQIKMSLSPPISVGYESNSEYIDVELFKKLELKEIMLSLNRYLPAGMVLIGAKMFLSPLNKIPSLNSTVNLMEYIVTYDDIFDKNKLKEFFTLKELIIEKHKVTDTGKEKVDKINLCEVIRSIEILDGHTIRMFLRFGPGKTLKPEVVISKIFDIPEEDCYKLNILRENLYIESSNYNLINLM